MSARPRNTFLVWLLVSALVGFFIAGHFMYRAAIGLDSSAFPLGEQMQALGELFFPSFQLSMAGIALAVLSILIVSVLTVVAVLRSVRSSGSRGSLDPGRRSFLSGMLAGVGAGIAAVCVSALGLFARAFRGVGNGGRGWDRVGTEIFGGEVVKTHPEWKEAWRGSRVQSYRRLGRTDWPVSDIVVGTGPLQREKGAGIVRLALERGVNYVDTAPDYSASGSEQAVGEGIASTDRGKLFLATKWCTLRGHLPPGSPVAVYRRHLESSLTRLGTDYVDLVHVHSCDELDRLLDPNMLEAFRQLKAEGKVRFLGFSSHTPNLVQVATAAIESGRFDVMMLAYHHGIWPQIGQVIERAHREQDMGVVAMKTLKGARHDGLEGFRDQAGAYSQAALRWVLSNPAVSCAVISFFELQHVDEYLFASGQPPAAGDLSLLGEYDRQIEGTYCSPHCGQCLESCPEGLPIADVLRHRMYYEDYGWEREATRLYSRLEKGAERCADCSAPCAGKCPLRIDIRQRMLGTHDLLTRT